MEGLRENLEDSNSGDLEASPCIGIIFTNVAPQPANMATGNMHLHNPQRRVQGHQVSIALISPGCSPGISYNEDALSVIVSHQQHGMEPMRRTLRVVGVRRGAEAHLWPEEALRQLQAEDNGMPLRQAATHPVQVHRNAGGLKDLARETTRTRRKKYRKHTRKIEETEIESL